ncbi:MAG: YicC/YloC family endoribonuclease [Burkholderiaceae bacterium]|jgi:uncharacterized protein (TIGR00255 family)
MTIYSMTGFGVACAPTPSGMASVELRSVNNRFFEFSARLPDECKSLEQSLREAVASRLPRGKLELRLQLSRTDSGPSPSQLEQDRLKALLETSHAVRKMAGDAVTPWTMHDLLRWPGILTEQTEPPEALEARVHALTQQAIDALEAARAREGSKLVNVITGRLQDIEQLVTKAKPLLPEALAQLSEKIRARLLEAFSGTSPPELEALVSERVRQESYAAAIRSDIAEELDRLQAHLQEMSRILRSPAAEPVGKRLDFLTQELHREANTLGSKSPSLALTQLAMEMKLAVEQIREQVQNIQ